MALTNRSVLVDSSWFHNPIVGKYFQFVLGIGAIFRRWIQSSKDSFLPGRSSNSKVSRLVDSGPSRTLAGCASTRPRVSYREQSPGSFARR
jgi:hypothetical protein